MKISRTLLVILVWVVSHNQESLSQFSADSLLYLFIQNTQKALIFDPFHAEQDYFFHQACFTTPKAFAYANSHNLPVILFVPPVLSGYSPVGINAPWIEGTRVALTWASIFYRFKELGHVDVRIVNVDTEPTLQNIAHALNTLLAFQLESSAHDIASLQQRFFSLSSLLKTPFSENPEHPISFEALHFGQLKHAPALITPSFHQQHPSQKRFLISGSAGFIGSHLTKVLLREGHQVIGLDNLSCCGRENIQDLTNNPNFYFFKHDVTHPFTVEGAIDYVIHLASIPSPAFYYRMPRETMEAGLHGTMNMLELALHKKAQFLFSSTSEVYGDPDVTPQEETYAGNVSPIGMRSQYDQSKRGAETLIKLYFERYGIDVRIARIFNTYGPNMQLGDGRVVTNFIRALLRQEPMVIHGSGTQTRSFSYIDDTIQGLLKFIHVPLPSTMPIQERVVNIGNSLEITIAELAHYVNTLAPTIGVCSVPIQYIPTIDETDPKQRNPNLQKARNLLGYEPEVSLIEGLEKTISYFQKMNT